jgi:hypothetical protein
MTSRAAGLTRHVTTNRLAWQVAGVPTKVAGRRALLHGRDHRHRPPASPIRA